MDFESYYRDDLVVLWFNVVNWEKAFEEEAYIFVLTEIREPNESKLNTEGIKGSELWVHAKLESFQQKYLPINRP